MFDKFKDMAGLLGQARELGQKMEQAQAELAKKTVEAEAGGGAVRVTINGKLEVQAVGVDRPLIATLAGQGGDADARKVEELLAAAFNAALTKAQDLVKEEMSRATGGLDLSGINKMLGGK
jgi:DNA-binding YbaB/EbfC family protein